MRKKLVLGLGGISVVAGAILLFMLMGGEQEQYAPTAPQPMGLPNSVNKPSPVNKPVTKESGDVSNEKAREELKDLSTGLPVSIARLDYEIARLEKEKKIEELKKDIEKIKRETKERTSSRSFASVPATPPPVPPPPPSPMMNFTQAQGGGEQPTAMRRPDWHVIGVACNEKCYATIRLGNGEVISVREGSTMPDGSTVARIDESGFVEFSNNIRRPVNMSLAEREKRETVKRDTRQPATPSLPVVLPPREAPRVIENYIQTR